MLTKRYLCFCFQCHDVNIRYAANHQIIITREEKKEKLWLLSKKSVPLHPLFASCDGELSKIT